MQGTIWHKLRLAVPAILVVAGPFGACGGETSGGAPSDANSVDASDALLDPDAPLATGHFEVCNDGIDNDKNGKVDCMDPACSTGCGCQLNELCTNGTDDDCDGLADCDDPACATHTCCSSTSAKQEACTNGVDDDCDGKVDCDDADCAGDNCCSGAPLPENCTNGLDDDCDGKTDCFDPDCAANPCPCQTPLDCPISDNLCLARTCESGVCGVKALAENTFVPASDPEQGDCFTAFCFPAGELHASWPNDSDFQEDGNPCTSDACFDGDHQVSALDGHPCGSGLICKLDVCVGCIDAASCPPGDECRIPKCTNGECGFYPSLEGHALNAQTAHDCLTRTCNSKGGVNLVPDDADLPIDGNPCTFDVCTNGVASNPNAPLGTPCGSAGQVCDGQGNCG